MNFSLPGPKPKLGGSTSFCPQENNAKGELSKSLRLPSAVQSHPTIFAQFRNPDMHPGFEEDYFCRGWSGQDMPPSCTQTRVEVPA